MSYPFPGMNPWLENPNLWRDVHQRTIMKFAELLAPQLEPRYFVGVETHTYISTSPMMPVRSRYPDVAIVRTGTPAVAGVATLEAAEPLIIDLPVSETYEEPFLEVRLVPDGEVVTVIELLSHTNKRPGRDRNDYIAKRETFLESDIHFVEIDLLREWEAMPFTQHPAYDYRIFVHRSERMYQGFLYGFSVQQTIPIFPLPLLPDDKEPLIDLGGLLHQLYDQARYKLVIDYNKPPVPLLNDDDNRWAKDQLQAAGLIEQTHKH